MIKLKKYEKFYLDDGFHIIRKGRVLVKDILPNGKIITNETILKEGEIIGNFFELLDLDNDGLILDIGIEMETLEETVLEPFSFSKKDLEANPILKKVIFQLIKKIAVKLLYQLYNKKGYLLTVLKFLADSEGKIIKKDIRYENINISKSQFYHLFSILKKEEFFKESNGIIALDLDKIETFLVEEYDDF